MRTKERRSRTLIYAALGGVLLAVGCTCVTVQVNCCSPPAPPSPNTSHGRVFGGIFAPVFGSTTGPGGTPQPICGFNVPKKWVDLTLPYNGQTPGPGEIGFVGRLYKSNTITGGAKIEIPNSDFILRLTYNASTFSCCTNLGDGFYVGCTNTPGLLYKFKAYWKTTGAIPPSNYKMYLEGGWTTM